MLATPNINTLAPLPLNEKREAHLSKGYWSKVLRLLTQNEGRVGLTTV